MTVPWVVLFDLTTILSRDGGKEGARETRLTRFQVI